MFHRSEVRVNLEGNVSAVKGAAGRGQSVTEGPLVTLAISKGVQVARRARKRNDP